MAYSRFHPSDYSRKGSIIIRPLGGVEAFYLVYGVHCGHVKGCSLRQVELILEGVVQVLKVSPDRLREKDI